MAASYFHYYICFCFFLEDGCILEPVSVVVVPCPSTSGEANPMVEGSAFFLLRLPIVHLPF